MAKKIIKGVGSALFGKKKKKAEPAEAAPAAPAKGPKVTPLGAAGLPLTKKRGLPVGGTMLGLAEKLGG